MRDDGKLGYYQLWRALKSINIKTFNIDSRDIENVIIKVLKLKDKAAAKRNGDGEKGVKDADMSQINFSANADNQLDLDQETLKQQIKKEIMSSHDS